LLTTNSSKTLSELTVCFVDDKAIRQLNRKYLGHNSATDVLTFDISTTAGEITCDIIISTDTAIRNARIFQTTHSYEIKLYIIHGLLHLLGYRDRSPKQRQVMHRKERQVLSKVNKLLNV
jgi:probable rRNA maturation factor